MNYPSWPGAATVESPGNVIFDANSHVQVVVAVSGDAKTGGSAPSWATTVGAQTVDNHVTWSEYAGAAPVLTANSGGPGGTASATLAGAAGNAGGGPSTSNLGPNISLGASNNGSNGAAGNTSSVPANGNNSHTMGGSSASVLVTTGACSAVATPGQAGYIVVKAFGAW
jgi:hypothetical protein